MKHLHDIPKIKRVKNLEFFANGKRGVVYTGFVGATKVAVKIKNPKSEAIGRIKHEAEILNKLNKYSIGPKLVESGNRYIVCKFAKGKSIKEFLESKKTAKSQIKSVLKQVFEQCFKMDKLGIQKQEMTNPYKHVVVNISKNNSKTKNNKIKVTLLDFERAVFRKNPSNVTQFCQYIMRNKSLLDKKGFNINKKRIMSFAKKYKDEFDLENPVKAEKNFKMIINAID